MKRFVLMVLLAGGFVPEGLVAQKVYEDGGNVILDLTVGAGMPAGAVTSVPKYISFTPSATKLGENNDQGGSINATVFRKLEVAIHDLTGNGTIGSAGGTFRWADAFNYCRSIGTGWRMPTQRELMLMYIFSPALDYIFTNTVGGTAFDSAYYWSATENITTYSWNVNFTLGSWIPYAKGTYCKVRCVKERD